MIKKMEGNKLQNEELQAEKVIRQRIFIIRNKRVMLDADLAILYDVSTKVLNQAIKRNTSRFPDDFMFRLTEDEKLEVVTNCDHLSNLRFSYALPYAFTEHGVAMLSSVLNSERAVQMNIFIIRAFIKMRELLENHKDLVLKVDEIEKRQEKQDDKISAIDEMVKKLLNTPIKPKGKIGFN